MHTTVLDYGCIIRSRVSSSNINRLTRLQKCAASIILHVDIMALSANMFQELQWLPFPKRIQYHTYIMMFKALNGIAPDYLSNMFLKTSDSHSLNYGLLKMAFYESPLQERATLKAVSQ